MKVVEEVRRERLLELREEFGSLAELNEALGFTRTDSTRSQIINRSANSKTKTPKTMGSPLARDLEAAAKKPRGWMDTDPAMGWPFENLMRGSFDRLTERQKGAVEIAVLEAIQKLIVIPSVAPAGLAVAYALRTGCAPAVAAARYKVGVRTVQRGMAAAGVARAAGRPAKSAPFSPAP